MTTTPADIRVRREALGLTQAWIAERLGADDRAVRRWEAGQRPIPEAVGDLLAEGEDHADGLVASVLVGLNRLVDDVRAATGEDPEGVDVTVYETDEDLWSVHPGFRPWPASWHRMVLAQLRVDLDPIQVTYHYGPAEA